MLSLLSPLGRNYGTGFYILSFVNLIFIVLIVLGFLFSLFSKNLEIKKHRLPMLYTLIAIFISYFQSRLLYGMCIGSLK